MSDLPPSPTRMRPAPLLPGRDARDGALIFVVATLCFLACLTGLAAVAAGRAAEPFEEVSGEHAVLRPVADVGRVAAPGRGDDHAASAGL